MSKSDWQVLDEKQEDAGNMSQQDEAWIGTNERELDDPE